ncbi:MAG: DUF4339 domain-containing protein, partial [Elusimicrobia bacterium]|nr:DUF4339 domain-containing protein [Elusimicrobiota bacterium]
MKYWVYKDARILGPYEREDLSGLPGVDAATLVCAGESASPGEGDWRPAGDVAELSGLSASRGLSWSPEEPPSTFGLLDKLQIDAAGLVGDDDFPGAAEALFQDADLRRSFDDLLSPRPSVDESALKRARDQISELTVQLEMLYKRVAELESSQTHLVHRLAEKELLLRRQPPPPPPPTLEALLGEAPPPAAPAPSPAEPSVPPAPAFE